MNRNVLYYVPFVITQNRQNILKKKKTRLTNNTPNKNDRKIAQVINTRGNEMLTCKSLSLNASKLLTQLLLLQYSVKRIFIDTEIKQLHT